MQSALMEIRSEARASSLHSHPAAWTTLQSRSRFHEVVAPHLNDAHVLARALSGNAVDSKDIVQEACLRAFRGISRFGGINARGWVMTIVRHTAYDWIKKKRAAPESVEDLVSLEEQQELRSDCVTPETEALLHQDTERVAHAIEDLPQLFREALTLRYEQELSYADIAETLGVPQGTVMSRLCRARRRLEILLKECATV
jgi:RNA polymerase sigma-70 factor (ECF subfamily)